MAATTSINTLPPELLTRVFSVIEDEGTIASCRLVCKDFHELSSPYLITRVVFAKRVDVISRLFDVLDHPYFKKHVTELLYDASYYDSELARGAETYRHARLESEGDFDTADPDQRRAAYLATWRRVNATSKNTEHLPASHAEMEESAIDDATEAVWRRHHYEYSQAHAYQEMILQDKLDKMALNRVLKELPRLPSYCVRRLSKSCKAA